MASRSTQSMGEYTQRSGGTYNDAEENVRHALGSVSGFEDTEASRCCVLSDRSEGRARPLCTSVFRQLVAASVVPVAPQFSTINLQSDDPEERGVGS